MNNKQHKPRTVRDYYTVELPGDVYDSLESLADLAISEARERARLYCCPAIWTATLVSGEVGGASVVFRVKRERRAK